MRIPPLYNDKSWQRFFAGFFIGALIGWVFFLYHFGLVHEKLVLQINEQKTTIQTQEETIEKMRESQDEQTEEMKKSLTVQEIQINFVNEKDVKLSEHTFQELRTSLVNELEEIRNKNIEDVANSEDLLIKAVENKIYGIGDKRYKLVVERLVLYTTVKMNVRIELSD